MNREANLWKNGSWVPPYFGRHCYPKPGGWNICILIGLSLFWFYLGILTRLISIAIEAIDIRTLRSRFRSISRTHRSQKAPLALFDALAWCALVDDFRTAHLENNLPLNT